VVGYAVNDSFVAWILVGIVSKAKFAIVLLVVALDRRRFAFRERTWLVGRIIIFRILSDIAWLLGFYRFCDRAI